MHDTEVITVLILTGNDIHNYVPCHIRYRTGKSRHDPDAICISELSQFRAPEKERTRKIKEEEDASSRSYEIFNNRITFWK